jgi:hypothetical protein
MIGVNIVKRKALQSYKKLAVDIEIYKLFVTKKRISLKY